MSANHKINYSLWPTTWSPSLRRMIPYHPPHCGCIGCVFSRQREASRVKLIHDLGEYYPTQDAHDKAARLLR